MIINFKFEILNLKLKKCIKGFTMIEILVVISIIGLLATMLMVRFSSVEKSSRDTVRRRSDLNQYRIALENYAARNNGSYPSCPAPNNTEIKDADDYLCSGAATGLPSDIMTSCPRDPRNDATYFYRYRCNLSANKYLLYAYFEDGNYFYICSSGVSGKVSGQPTPNNECGWNPAI